jgi:hypothetical protein
MGNRRHTGRAGTGTKERSANTVSAASPELPAGPPASQSGNGCPPRAMCHGIDLDPCIQELVDAAPPLTDEQRDTLTLLLRRPRRK